MNGSRMETQIVLLKVHNCDARIDITKTCGLPMQYTAIFHGCKNDNFRMKIFDCFLFFAQNIDCGYTLEPPE